MMTPQRLDPAEDDGLVLADDARARTRLCAVTRKVLPVDALIRFVAAPDGVVVADIRNRLPGRGLWVGANRALVMEAQKRKLFSRHLKAEVIVPPDLADGITRLLAEDALQMLAFANKAGGVITGFDKIAGQRGPYLALVQASDGSKAEIARLRGLCRGKGPRKNEPVLIDGFTAAELGLSMGREHVIHAALGCEAICAAFVGRAQRFMDYMARGDASRRPPACSAQGQGRDDGASSVPGLVPGTK